MIILIKKKKKKKKKKKMKMKLINLKIRTKVVKKEILLGVIGFSIKKMFMRENIMQIKQDFTKYERIIILCACGGDVYETGTRYSFVRGGRAGQG